jgi:hypothetical protein
MEQNCSHCLAVVGAEPGFKLLVVLAPNTRVTGARPSQGVPLLSPLATGDIVTTGTLTRAFPILPGESWSTTLHGIELGGRPVWFA